MEVLSTIRSQLNNVRNTPVFSPVRLATSALKLPFEYFSPSAEASAPMVINFLVAARCNLKCVMCTADKLMGAGVAEMTGADYERIVNETLPFRPSFFFGGGEPFLRHDILDLIRLIKKHDLSLGMVTNALQVTPEKGEAVKQAGLDSIMFSIHGTEQAHDRITGARGSYRQAIANVAAFCRKPRKTKVMVNFVLQPENLEDVFNLVEKARTLGVDQVRVEHLLYITAAETDQHRAWVQGHVPEALRPHLEVATYNRPQTLPESHVKRLQEILVRLRETYGDFVFIKPWLDTAEVDRWYEDGYDDQRACVFVWRSLFIDAQGYVLPCQSYPEMKFGNALKEPLLEIWNSPRYREFRQTIRQRRLPGCARCCKT